MKKCWVGKAALVPGAPLPPRSANGYLFYLLRDQTQWQAGRHFRQDGVLNLSDR